jgi:hypothetical protein
VIRLLQGAFLYHRPSVASNPNKTDLTLWNTLVFPRTEFSKSEDDSTQGAVSETTIALLHLATMQRKPQNLLDVEEERFAAERQFEHELPVCGFE